MKEFKVCWVNGFMRILFGWELCLLLLVWLRD